MRKNTLLMFVLLAYGATGTAQTMIKLGDDACGDTIKYSGFSTTLNHPPDIKSVSYSLNAKKDTISFEIETCNALSPSTDDMAFVFGIDKNMSQADGNVWKGSNSAFKCDNIFYLYRSTSFGVWFTEDAAGSTTIPPTYTRIYNNTNFLFHMDIPMAWLDDDGNFNLVVGTGKNDPKGNTMNDNAPNTGSYIIGKPNGITNLGKATISVYPNPVARILNIDGAAINSEILLYDMSGRKIDAVRIASAHATIDMITYAAGLYFYQLNDESGLNIQSGKVVLAR